MKKTYRVFQGTNRVRLERNIEEFKQKLGERFIGMCLMSNNPEYQIKVEYWEE